MQRPVAAWKSYLYADIDVSIAPLTSLSSTLIFARTMRGFLTSKWSMYAKPPISSGFILWTSSSNRSLLWYPTYLSSAKYLLDYFTIDRFSVYLYYAKEESNQFIIMFGDVPTIFKNKSYFSNFCYFWLY